MNSTRIKRRLHDYYLAIIYMDKSLYFGFFHIAQVVEHLTEWRHNAWTKLVCRTLPTQEKHQK